jgi:hypothetical protein
MLKRTPKFSRFLLFLLLPLSLNLAQCGDNFQAGLMPFAGTMSINGGPPITLTWPNVAIVPGGTTTTITISNSFSSGFGNNQFSAINLVLPNAVTGVPIDLSITTSNMVETTTNSFGAIISTDFTSTAVTGTATVFFLDPNSTEGFLSATFTDGSGNTRAFSGDFVFGVF